MKLRSIKLLSDGTVPGTKVLDAETNEPIKGVVAIKWELSARDRHAVAEITFCGIPIEAAGTEGIVRQG